MESKPVFINLETAEGKCHSLHDLISFLKSAFRPVDFDTVERVLASREEDYRRAKEDAEARNGKALRELEEELHKRKAEFEVISEKHGDLALEKCLLEDEVGRHRSEGEIFRETVLRLREENRLLSDREKRATERCETLLKCQKPSQDEESVSFLKNKVRDLKCGKDRAEAELETCLKRFEELRARVVRLEEDTASLFSEKEGIHLIDTSHIKEEKESAPDDFSSPRKEEEGDPYDSEVINRKSAEKQLLSEEACFDKNMDSLVLGSCQPLRGSVVDITSSDSDEASYKSGCKVEFVKKRKRDSLINSSKCDEDAPTSKHKLKPLEESITKSKEMSSNRCSVLQSSGGNNVMKSASGPTRNQFPLGSSLGNVKAEPKSSNHFGKIVHNASTKNNPINSGDRVNWKWDSEVEMILAFSKHPEICMEAVCALCRQNIHVVERVRGQDFNRESTLVKFLVDGDPHCKLKKSFEDLQKWDPRSFPDCKRLAFAYSKQLFDIYRKKKDPLFCPP